MEERVPPQNIEAEQSVLGAMLIDKEAIAKATEILGVDDFYREAHRVIFAAMLELYNKNEAVDLITVTDILRRDNKLEDIGGIAYITSLANVVLTAANVKYHADIVAEKSVLRQLVRVHLHYHFVIIFSITYNITLLIFSIKQKNFILGQDKSLFFLYK